MHDTLSVSAIAELRHELRTPVNIISGYAEMLLEDLVDQGADAGALADALRGIGTEMREVLRLIGTGLPASAQTVTKAQLGELLGALRARRSVILALAATAVAAATSDAEREDLRRIEQAAEGMASVELTLQDDAEPSPERTGTFAAVNPMQPARLLIVDDVEDNRSVLRRRLERMGHTVRTAEDGETALAMAREDAGELDLILLDMRMPGRDGYQTLLELKADDRTRDIPVVMISALDEMSSIARCIAQGAEDYLPKPFDPLILHARVGATLERKRLRDRERDFVEQTMLVIDAARAVEEARYDSDVLAAIGRRGDELGRLARVFDGMATEVRAREARLLTQLDDLRREIDVVRGAGGESGTSGARFLTGGGVVPSTPALQVGQRLAGRYDIFDVAGQGGMGRVFRATDRELGGIVAIKTLRGDALRERPELRDWLKSEVRLGRRITHANVVRTYDFGEADDVAFITMEYVDGVSLRRMLDTRGTLTTGSAIALGTQLFRALQAAHEQGVVHRDIKPENVLLSDDGVLKVMDFGIARLLEGTDGSETDGWGTMSYMAPEQMLNEVIDARADLYAAGVLLYEALTGELPFRGGSTAALIAAVLTGAPMPVSARNPEVSGALSGLVDALLAPAATDRPKDAKYVVQALEQMR